MANWLTKILASFSPARAPRARRSFDAALVSRLTSGWTGANRSINADLEGSLEMLRGRSRNLAANSWIARRYLQLVGTNIVGPDGPTLRAKAVDYVGGQPVLDAVANAAIEEHWWRWTQPGECDVAGRQSFADQCRVVAEGTARDGDQLVRFVRSRESTYGLQLRILDIDRLDTRYSVQLSNGNVVRMGVEIDPVGRPVAYHLFATHPNDSGPGRQQGTRERVPVSEVLHVFRADRPEQVRGFPWMHAVMSSVNMFDGFVESAVVNARVGAAKLGWFRMPEGSGSGLADEQDETGTLMLNGEPGTFGIVPEGAELVDWSPEYPHEQFGPFVTAMTQGIAAGVGVAAHSLNGDLSKVNYSSSRTAELTERDKWKSDQQWFVDSFVMPVAQAWLETALLRSAITLPNGSALPAAKRAKFAAGLTFQPRRWTWVDPQKEAAGQVAAIGAGLKSRTQVAAEQGLDINEILDELAAEQKRIDSLGLRLDTGSPPAAPAPDPQENVPV